MPALPRRCSLYAFLVLGAISCGDAATAPDGDRLCGTPLSLRRGEVRVVTGPPNVSCVAIAGSSEATDYLLIAANAMAKQDDLGTYLIRSSVAGASSALAPFDQAPASWPDELESRVRVAERSVAGRLAATRTAVPKIGDTLSYRVGDASSANLCTTYTPVRAVVKAVGTTSVIVQDITAPSGGFSNADFSALAAEFDALIYPTDVQWFGKPTDVNGDSRITVVYTPAINRLTPPGSLGYVGGFFFLSDLSPRANCAASNEQEILYLLTPDPAGQVNGNRFSVETAREAGRGTAAHELQHLINQGTRLKKSAELEVAWLNEALAHFAEEAVGRAARKYSDGQRLTYNDVLTDLDDFDSFFRQNLIRFRAWMQRPDLASPVSEKASSQLAPRGAGWALVRYATDRYGGGDARGFVRALVAGPEVDIRNLETRTGASFEDILPGFLVASVGETSVEPRYTFSSWAMRGVMTEVNGGVFPLQVKSFPTDVATQSLSGSGNYFLLSRAAGSNTSTFRMTAPGGSPVEFAGARVYVVRVK
jgi:hypothetical protein